MKQVLWSLLFVSCGLFTAKINAEDQQLWVSANKKLFKEQSITGTFYAETRSKNGIRDLSGIFAGPKLSYQLNERVKLATAAKYIRVYKENDYDQLQRLELEASYSSIRKSNGWRFGARNRIEIIDKDNKVDGHSYHRYRIRVSADKDISFAHIKRFHIRQEWILDEDYQLTEYRLVPFAFTLKDALMGAQVSYLLRRKSKTGEYSHVLGLAWQF
ncbi:DUF2490 domain-containing protein [Pseudoalteromonas phenolica]|uniref:DUF2490 domain-containing protein n=1 Tax=Pseudoalteromonas phenolica TaxID=161398 RepID=UPI001485FBC9|nr:DUF2490 domain-containing protein [Pseudoalteromonas phenolica]